MKEFIGIFLYWFAFWGVFSLSMLFLEKEYNSFWMCSLLGLSLSIIPMKLYEYFVVRIKEMHKNDMSLNLYCSCRKENKQIVNDDLSNLSESKENWNYLEMFLCRMCSRLHMKIADDNSFHCAWSEEDKDYYKILRHKECPCECHEKMMIP